MPTTVRVRPYRPIDRVGVGAAFGLTSTPCWVSTDPVTDQKPVEEKKKSGPRTSHGSPAKNRELSNRFGTSAVVAPPAVNSCCSDPPQDLGLGTFETASGPDQHADDHPGFRRIQPGGGPTMIFPRLGALPMVNVLLVGLVIGRHYGSAADSSRGFEAFGTMALAIYITLDHLISCQIATGYLNLAISPYLDIHGHRLTAMNHVELNAIVVAMLGLPIGRRHRRGRSDQCVPAAVDEESLMRQRRMMWTAVGVLALSTAGAVVHRSIAQGPRHTERDQVWRCSPSVYDVSGSSPAQARSPLLEPPETGHCLQC